MVLTKLVATAACLSLTIPGIIARPEREEIEPARRSTRNFFQVTTENTSLNLEQEAPASLDWKLHQFADVREKLSIKEGEIDDSTERFLLNNKLFFLLFGLLFCWIAVKSLGSKN